MTTDNIESTLAEIEARSLDDDDGIRSVSADRRTLLALVRELMADARRYRWLRSQTRARFADTQRDVPQLIYTKRSDPFISGYAKRVDDAVDAAIAIDSALAQPAQKEG